MSKISEPKPVEQLSYEEVLTELNRLVEALENEDHPLEETMRLFERGQALSRRAAELLDGAELKVRQLIGEELVELEDE